MFCTNCGVLVNEGEFCSKCGVKATSTINVTEEQHVETIVEPRNFTFIRHKSIGRGDISHIISEVNISNSALTLKQQKIILYFFKKKPIETAHNIMDIASMKIVRTFDISDTIFSIIFALLGFLNPVCFIPAVILFWIGIGKKIQMTKSNGATISIPAENLKPCSELSELLISINKGIVFQQNK